MKHIRLLVISGFALALVAPALAWTATQSWIEQPDKPQTIAEFFGNPTEAQILSGETALHDRVEQHIAGCMSRAGQPYLAQPYPVDATFVPGGRTLYGRPNPPFKRRFGYGISTLVAVPRPHMTPAAYRVPRLHPTTAPSHAATETETSAPPASLTPATSGRQAEPSQPAAPPVDDRYRNALGRCQDAADHGVLEAMVQADSRLEAHYSALERRMAADPRIQAAMAAWSDCMRTGSRPFDSPAAIESHLRERLTMVTATDAHDTLVSDRAGLLALQHDELAISALDDRCRQQHVTTPEAAVRHELEPAFVAENVALLRQLRGDPPVSHTWPAMAAAVSAAGALAAVLLIWRRTPDGTIRDDRTEGGRQTES